MFWVIFIKATSEHASIYPSIQRKTRVRMNNDKMTDISHIHQISLKPRLIMNLNVLFLPTPSLGEHFNLSSRNSKM